MFESPYRHHALGINRNSKAIYVAQISLCKSKFNIEQLSRLPLTEITSSSDHVKQLYMVADTPLNTLADRIRSATALPTSAILVRPLQIDLVKKKDVDAVFAFQAEPLLPYPFEEAVLNKITLSQSSENTQLTLIAARKIHVQKHIEEWQLLDLEPEVISCVPAALAAFSKYCITSDSPYILLYIGEDHVSAILAKEGKLMGSYSFSEGIYHIEKTVSTDLRLPLDEAHAAMCALDFAAISSESMPLSHALSQQMRMGIARIVYALLKQSKGEEIGQILVTGPGCSLKNLSQLLTQGLFKEATVAHCSAFGPVTDLNINSYAIPIGLALNLYEDKELIDFRKEELTYPRPWKRIKRPLTALMTFGVLCAVLIYFFGQIWLGYQEDGLRERYGQLLVAQHMTLEGFEAEFRKKSALSPMQEGDILVLKKFTTEEIEQRLEYLYRTLESTPETFPLQPNTPRVSDVLAWLSAHPNMSRDAEDEEGLLRIENISYNIVRRPEQSKKQERYQVKIELDFASPTPKLAREFHDALIAPNDFVDPKGEVKWSANRGKYHTSFFLKDKTIYPSLQGGA